MMLKEDQERFATYDNYRNLMFAIIYQACQDYANVLKDSKIDKKIKPHNSSSYRFIIDNPYCDILDLDGKSLINKMESNFKKYGKATLSDLEWDMVAELGKIINKFEWDELNKKKGDKNNIKNLL